MIAPNAGLSVNRQCTLLGIARSSFYYQRRPVSAEEIDLLNRLDRIFTAHPVYGSRRLQVALLREGISVGRRRIRRLMRKLGLCAIRPKRNTSQPHPEHKIYPYLLRDKTIDQPNRVWATDITYIPMRQGFLYLVAIIDWATRRVLSWRLSNTLTAGFCVDALSEALARFGKPEIFNSDSKNDGVGKLSTIPSWQSDEWPEHRRHSEVSSVALTRTPIDRCFASFPGSVGRLRHQAVRFHLTDACDPRRA
jgi:putative transposase